jgi:signal transduction histidine kinase
MARSGSASAPRAAAASAPAAAAFTASSAIQLHLLSETPRLFAVPLPLGRILTKFAALVAGSLEVGSVLLLLREEGETEFLLRAGRGVPRRASRTGIACDDPLLGPLCAGGRPLVAPGAAAVLARDPRWRASRLRQLLPAATGSVLALPLAVRGCLRGALVLSPPPGAPRCGAADVEWFLPIAEQVSLALEKLTLTRKLEEAGRALEVTVRARTREAHEANAALRRSLVEIKELRRFSEQVIASLASSLVTFHGAGWVMTANPPARAVLHLGEESVQGLNLADLFGAEFAAALLPRLQRRNVHITRAQAGIVLRTGEQKAIGYSVTPLRRTHAGISWILLFRDITDSQRLGSEMRRLDRLVSLGEISANVAHELKNPLTVMYANMEWLLERLPPEFHKRVQITIDHMERMEAIIGRMGILAKDQPLLNRPIDLGDLVGQMLAFVDKTLCEKRIDLVVAVPAVPQWVSGDPAQLQQALLNLIMNAAQAIGEHGTITVRLERRPRGGSRGVELSISDTGPGIPAHLIGKIFEPFFTTKETGTGLGLSITSQIVAAHNGRIVAENLPGRGACVRLWFPEGEGRAPAAGPA